MSGTRMSTGQLVLGSWSPLCFGDMYMSLAEYLHSGSMGQERQFVAVPAATGLRVRVNCCTEPEDVIVSGRWGGAVGSDGGGEQRSQRRRSISWQDFVRRDGAVVDSLRQFPLFGC